ncbi:MAG: hypothetical protein ACHQNA_10185 [Acidimicrobiales bacterium]
MTGDNRWYSVLDDLDAHLLRQEEALDAGRPDLIVAFDPPSGLGPLPPNLEPRWALLGRRSADLLEHTTTRRDAIARRLATLPRRRTAPRPSACYLDTSG